MEIINKEVFANWVLENSKSKFNDLDEWLTDLEKRHEETGTTTYEMSPFETKSGRTECISYEYECIWDNEKDECVAETYTF